jgi:diacylglycerol kinase family enzyme
VPFQLDGDPGGYLPVDVRVLPRRLTLVVGMAETKMAGKMTGAVEP